jgi:hypothetical protein
MAWVWNLHGFGPIAMSIHANFSPQSLAEGDDLCYLKLSGVPMVRRIVLVWRAQSNRQACLMSILGVLREFH